MYNNVKHVRMSNAKIEGPLLLLYLDSKLSMEHHISTVVRVCFFHLRRLKSIRQILSADVTSGLVSAFVTTRMDYCNSILAALPQSSIDPLHGVQNAAARLITGIGTREHITPVLWSLHWLPVKFHITFKLCVLMVHIGRAPAYLSDMVTAATDMNFHYWSTSSVREASLMPDRKLGMIFLLLSKNLLIRVLSKGNWKLISLHWHILTVVHNLISTTGHFRCKWRMK